MSSTFVALSVALGIGLLVGAERERRKGSSPDRSAAGIRTFAIASIMGAVGMLIGDVELLALVVFMTGCAAMIAYRANHKEDPGLTTEFALVLTSMLGGMAVKNALLAAGVGVLLALLLVARNAIHHFVKTLLTAQDLEDTLIFSATALIVMPLVPDQFMGPFHALNPRNLVMLVVVVMAISAAGYVGTRWLGPRHGLPLAGFAAGFVSSTATIHSMGQRSVADSSVAAPAVAGAVLSSIATFVQMSVLIGLVQPGLLRLLALPLLAGGAVALFYGLYFLWRARRDDSHEPMEQASGRAFNLRTSVTFALLLGGVMIVSAGLNAWLGDQGLVLGAVVAGLADAHATAASAASLVASGKIQATQAVLPILLGLTANTLTKAVVAYHAAGMAYARKIVPGLATMILAVWAGYWVVAA
ncbi:MgtC/SapB family protein [Rhodoferax sp. GW822-FHT02A01]|uniref:MgtC/SapB family protein n=1 Tax=Rhodoferax sp. GW822-FHT02A01 TaxID=3141537 RepID=UPI00315DC0E2